MRHKHKNGWSLYFDTDLQEASFEDTAPYVTLDFCSINLQLWLPFNTFLAFG